MENGRICCEHTPPLHRSQRRLKQEKELAEKEAALKEIKTDMDNKATPVTHDPVRLPSVVTLSRHSQPATMCYNISTCRGVASAVGPTDCLQLSQLSSPLFDTPLILAFDLALNIHMTNVLNYLHMAIAYMWQLPIYFN